VELDPAPGLLTVDALPDDPLIRNLLDDPGIPFRPVATDRRDPVQGL
jgi:hypothetical protein